MFDYKCNHTQLSWLNCPWPKYTFEGFGTQYIATKETVKVKNKGQHQYLLNQKKKKNVET